MVSQFLLAFKPWMVLIYDRVLESLKAGKRLPETSFSNLKVAPKGQSSVYSMFKKTDSTESKDSDTSEAVL